MGADGLIMEIMQGLSAPPARGRRSSISISKVRDLNEGDIKALWDLPEGGLESTTPLVRTIRASHHTLARCLAEGKKGEECQLITGYSVSRISELQKDPTFAQLVEYYKGQIEGVFINVYERLAALGIDSIDELQKRLDESPEDFTLNQLMELAKMTLDRAGHGPTTKSQNTSMVALITPTQLENIKREVQRRENGAVLSIGASRDKGSEVGGVIIDGTGVEVSPSPRSESQGDDV